jgi:DNA-binding response OmpR family regulator
LSDYEDGSASQSSNPFVGRSILIVQKQWLVARGLALAFEAKGARALLARDAAVGLELSNYPDLAAAVLDSDSAQLWRFLNEKKIPCVVYSGSEQIDDEWAGATVIRKPASANEVVGSVERMLGPRDHAP